MKNLYPVIKICSIALLVTVCYLTPPVIFYALLVLLFLRVFLFLRPTKGQKIKDFQNPQKVLFVIDMQESMCGKSGIYSGKEELVKNVNELIRMSEQQNQNVVYICQEFHFLDFIFCFLTMGGRLFQGLAETSLCSDLKISDNAIFTKHQQDAFTNQALSTYLNENEVDTISIVGLDASACVFKTALGAANRGYHVTVLRDCVLGRNNILTERALQKLSAKGIAVH